MTTTTTTTTTPTNGDVDEVVQSATTSSNVDPQLQSQCPAESSKNHTTSSPHDNDNNESSQDVIEQSLGIQEYLSSIDLGFSAVVKARYSDFVVHEVDLNGNIARLTCMEIPSSFRENTDRSEPAKEENDELMGSGKIQTEIQKEKTAKEEDNDESMVSGKIQKEDLQEKETKASSKNNASVSAAAEDDDDLEAQLAAMINDKQTAKKVLQMLESHDKAVSDDTDLTMKDGENADEKYVTLPSLEKTQRKAVYEWVRKSLPSGRGDTMDGKIRIWHVKFEKEMSNYKSFRQNNHNNNNYNSRPKRPKPSWPADRPDYLRFVLYKENIDTTTATRDLVRRGSRTRIGYAGMKDKRGITTQFCTLYRSTPEQIVNSKTTTNLTKSGGGNTKQGGSSIVRLGNFEYVSQEQRLGMLRGNRFDIIMRNVKAPGDDVTAQRQILERAAESMKNKGFINYFGTQRFGKFNDTHLVGIAVLQGNYQKAIEILMKPKSSERPDINQARIEWKERFKNGETKENEAKAARNVLKKLNRFMAGENAVLQSLSRHPMDYARAFGCIPLNLRTMFIHAAQSLIWNRAASYRIASMDKNQVLVGDLVSNGTKNVTSNVHIVTQDDIDNKTYTLEDVLLPLVGKKTKFPNNQMGSVMHQMLSDIGIHHDMFKGNENRNFIVNGDYRKIICHPHDFEYKIQEYYDPLQPLLQTDLMKLQGEEIVIAPPSDEVDSATKLTAVIVGFTLPSSSYATIALRELMKRPTSNEFQKELTLE